MNRSTSWLKTAAAGMLALVAGLGLTASAQSNALYLDRANHYCPVKKPCKYSCFCG